ncbi:molybdopterin-guanine dinucleotide biosynthesis protein B [Agrilactobacillus yilanensis]|uniref:Molybdopterin-guanine dinucleotide biosynthesis protein B n=1 Tax=Agrilactobacillus yilanensis TaxID=2485997 RepID=A0ABW4J7D3_9LACO|nr:molybdopterin-guanine dinucleotide biosynthesis protein B [Agrilactobacillus yilanensis]
MALTLQVIGYKKCGKTTVLTDFLIAAQQLNLKTAIFKHNAHNDADLDQQRTDTHRFRQTGVAQIILRSDHEVFVRKQQPAQLNLPAMIATYTDTDTDLILVEGFKTADYPKLVLLRSTDKLTDFTVTHLDYQATLWPEKVKDQILDFSTAAKRQAWFETWLTLKFKK